MLLQKTKNCLKLVAENDFNAASADSAKLQLLQAINNSTKNEIVLVFSKNDVIDDAGLKLLIGLYQECLTKKLKLSLNINNASVMDAIRLCRLDQLIDVRES